jgi:hypothetical protein
MNDKPMTELEKYQKSVKDDIELKSRVKMKPVRKLQLPKKLIILSVEWDILYFDRQVDVDEDKEEHLFGQTVYEKAAIRVFRGKRKKEQIFETIFHEWVHIILLQLDYRYAFTRTDEERFVHAFSNALNDLFWRNFR